MQKLCRNVGTMVPLIPYTALQIPRLLCSTVYHVPARTFNITEPFERDVQHIHCMASYLLQELNRSALQMYFIVVSHYTHNTIILRKTGFELVVITLITAKPTNDEPVLTLTTTARFRL